MAAQKPWWRETLETVFWALVLALVIRTFIIQAFYIPSISMVPTLEINDRVIVPKFWYYLPKISPQRGQIIVFEYPKDPSKDYVKRIIAIPGDTVEMRDGVVYVNDKEVFENYVKNTDTYTLEKFTVPEDNYFCLGDNRPNSMDSRFWGFVPKKNIIGPAVLRYWPLGRIGIPK